MSFAALSDALISHYQHYSSQVSTPPVTGLFVFVGQHYQVLSTTSTKTSLAVTQQVVTSPQPYLSEATQASFVNVPTLQSNQARHQHTVMLISNLHDEHDMSATTKAIPPERIHSSKA
ncbi:MAG: hypothetical protein AAF267_04235, partial [Deinococcota bacterium]